MFCFVVKSTYLTKECYLVFWENERLWAVSISLRKIMLKNFNMSIKILFLHKRFNTTNHIKRQTL